MTFKLLMAVGTGLVLISGAHAQEQESQAIEGYALTGETRSCLQLRQIDDMEMHDDENLLITTRSGDAYLSKVGSGCSQAGGLGAYIQTNTSGRSLCRNDIIYIRDSTFNGTLGSCRLGEFEQLVPLESNDHS